MEKMLLIDIPPNKHHGWVCAAAIFEKADGEWRCVHSAPILRWFQTTPIGNIAYFLKRGGGKREGWKYEWVNLPTPSSQ